MKVSKRFYNYIALLVFCTFLSSYSAHAQTPLPDKASLTTTIAQQTQQKVVNSGDTVHAVKKEENKTNTTVQNNNTATTNQTTAVSVNTGGNSADRNISIGGNAGVIQTGNVGVVTQSQAGGNTNVTAISSPTSPPGTTSGANTNAVNTGNNVATSSSTSNTNNTNVQNNNTAHTNQTTTVNANTGNNHADRNISIGGNAGVIQTGSVGVFTDARTLQNGNATIIGGSNANQNGPGPGASVSLFNTGNNVGATSSASNTSSASVTNNNTSFVNQATTVNADTGHNTANRNIAFGGDAGVIKTGAVLVNANYAADGNMNRTTVSGQGSGSGDAFNGNPVALVNSGDNTRAVSSVNNENSTSVANNNASFVNQQLFINANTGGNSSSRNLNTGGSAGEIQTGNVGVFVSFLADLSRNKTVVYPTTTNYVYTPVQYAQPTPDVKTVYQQPVYYVNPVQDRVYYYYMNPPVRTQFASYVYNNSNAVGTYDSQSPLSSNQQALLAGQEKSPLTMSVGGLSQLTVMIVSLGALALRKMMRV